MSSLREAVLTHFRDRATTAALTVDSATYSYAVLGQLAAEAASEVRSRLGRDRPLRVATLSSGTLTTYVAMLTAFMLDATYIPLDPAAPTARMRDVLARSRPDVVLIDQRHLARLADLDGALPVFEPLEARWYGAATTPPSTTTTTGTNGSTSSRAGSDLFSGTTT